MTRNWSPALARPGGRSRRASPRSARRRARLDPMNTAQVAHSSSACSMAGCHALARDQVPLVEPGLDPLAPQPDGQLLDRRLVGAAVREEHVVFEAGRRHRVGLHH